MIQDRIRVAIAKVRPSTRCAGEDALSSACGMLTAARSWHPPQPPPKPSSPPFPSSPIPFFSLPRLLSLSFSLPSRGSSSPYLHLSCSSRLIPHLLLPCPTQPVPLSSFGPRLVGPAAQYRAVPIPPNRCAVPRHVQRATVTCLVTCSAPPCAAAVSEAAVRAARLLGSTYAASVAAHTPGLGRAWPPAADVVVLLGLGPYEQWLGAT